MISDKIAATGAMQSDPAHWDKRKWQVLIPLNIADGTYYELCRCFSAAAATEVVRMLTTNETGGPCEVVVRVIYET